jgi:uncharacterized repeat protein (TIGR03943 family)
MTAVFNRWLPGVTLAVWSSVLLTFAIGGRLTAFLAPAYRPWVLPAGIILAVMALVFFLFPADAACCRSAACGHPLSRFGAGKWLTFLILVLPVAVAARYTPMGFSKTAMQNRGIVTDASALPALKPSSIVQPLDLPLPQETPEGPGAKETVTAAPTVATTPDATAGSPAPATVTTTTAKAGEAPSLDSYVQKTKEGYLEAEVLDLLYAAQDNTLRKVFEGKTVQLIGQLMPDPADGAQPGAHRFKAVRMFMTCCAADARPVATVVEAPNLPILPEMTWVRIVGKATFPVENGRRAALLQAETVEKTEPPPESMLY